MSCGSAELGMLTVFEMAPERKGWTAPIIRMWPMSWIERVPLCGLNAQSKTARSSPSSPGAPSMVSISSMNWRTDEIVSAE